MVWFRSSCDIYIIDLGADTSLYIQVTVSWSFKVFAFKAPVNVSVNGMDLSPLLHSQVRLSGDDVVSTYSDDLAIRLPVTLLPSGYYGAIFRNIAFNDSAVDVKLNFTMTYPGGQQYHDDVITYKAFPPIPFTRAGQGFPTYTPLLTQTPNPFFYPGGSPPSDAISLDLYRGYDDNVITSSNANVSSRCAVITDAKRRAWCLESGFSIDPLEAPPQNVLLTPGINVIGLDKIITILP
jgi:hypothetical protein